MTPICTRVNRESIGPLLAWLEASTGVRWNNKYKSIPTSRYCAKHSWIEGEYLRFYKDDFYAAYRHKGFAIQLAGRTSPYDCVSKGGQYYTVVTPEKFKQAVREACPKIDEEKGGEG